MASYLLCSSPIGGHVAPVLAVGAQLAERGHRVRMLTGSRFKAAIEHAGAEHVPLPTAADYDDLDLNGAFPGREKCRGPQTVQFDLEHMFTKPAVHQADAVADALAAEPYDGILAEISFAGLLPLLLSPGPRPPVHVLGVIPMTLSSRDTAPFGLGLQPLPGIVGQVRNAALTTLVQRVVLRTVQKNAAVLLAEAGYSIPDAFLLDWYRQADSVSQLTMPGFEYPRRDLPPHIRCVGPLLPAGGAVLPDWWADLDGDRPVVHVTQGTLDNGDLSQLLMPTLEALADEPALVVAATGGKPIDRLPGPIPANARVAPMLPYHQLLPRTDVLVTNGGYGGVQFALTYGVPMVVAGTTEDKPEVAARVAWSGAGINLRSRRPKPARIRHAVQHVLRDPSYREASRRLQAEADGLDAMQSILGLLEFPVA